MTAIEDFDRLRSHRIEDFDDIGLILDDLEHNPLPPMPDDLPFLAGVARGVAFVTFAYDIDGVAMEIAKYGATLGEVLSAEGYDPAVYCVGGNFGDKVDVVLPADWPRVLLHNADGWDKWENGEWFAQLFSDAMPAGSAASREMAATMWS
ncbi:MAG: hypothetical protein ACNYZH_07830, partial [Acidimicrobiia bacterium]